MQKILFVCSGNICRSPMAEGVFNAMAEKNGMAEQIQADSSGIHESNVGQNPDPRAIEAAKQRGYDISAIVAKQVDIQELSQYRLILCMDDSHFEFLMNNCQPDDETKLKMFLHFAEDLYEDELPDPYLGTDADFETSMDKIESACHGLINQLKAQVF